MGMCICNDRRWPETYRVMGLQNVEMVLLGYNTPLHNAPSPDHDEHSWFHNQLSMQAGAYQNGTWVVGVAKGGSEEDVPSLADSMIVAPSGKVVARAGRRRRRADRPSLRSRCRPELQAHDLQLRDPPPARPVSHDRRAQGRDGSVMKGRTARPSYSLWRRHSRQARRGRDRGRLSVVRRSRLARSAAGLQRLAGRPRRADRRTHRPAAPEGACRPGRGLLAAGAGARRLSPHRAVVRARPLRPGRPRARAGKLRAAQDACPGSS